MSIRESFVAEFGEDQAVALENAAEMHNNSVHSRRGSDPFKWAVAIAIGYECLTVDEYRSYHGVAAPADKIKAWIRESADLASHDGDVDYIGLRFGVYEDYLPNPMGAE